MTSKPNPMATRRDVLKQVFTGVGYVAIGGIAWGGLLKDTNANPLILRPPGALPENDFLKACIKCGLCIEACPYDSLVVAQIEDSSVVGTPYFKARETPCYMCTDIPCVPPCPSGALDINLLCKPGTEEPDINNAIMGLANINQETCVAYWGVQCDACYRACPLLGEAIILSNSRNKRTGKHAFIIPNVSAEACTGCGLCEHACITEIPAIKVFPREMVMGKNGSHYIKGWDKSDEKHIQENQENIDKYDNSAAIDYLNNSDDLFNDN